MKHALIAVLAGLATAVGCSAPPPSIPCVPCSAGPCAAGATCELGYCVQPGEDARRCPAIPTAATSTSGTTATAATSTGSGTSGTTGTTGGGATTGSGTPLTCVRSDGANHPVLADTPFTVTCTGPVGGNYTVMAPPLLAIANDLNADGTMMVTLPSASLPLGFSDQTATLQIAHSSGATAMFTLDLVGNLLIGGSAGVVALASTGTVLGTLVASAQAGNVSLLALLADGSLLVGSPDQGLQRFDLMGNPLSMFDSTDHANNPLFGGDWQPWGAAQDSQGDVWVSRTSASDATNNALLMFDGSGNYLQTQDPPGGLSGDTWVPQGLAVLSDGTVAVAAAGTSAPTLALFPPGGTPILVVLPFQTCVSPGNGAAVSCGGNPQSYGAASGLLGLSNELLVATQQDRPFDSFVGAFTNPDLGFISSTARVDPTTDYGILDTGGLATLANDGVYVIAAQVSDACLLALDPQTLYVPAGWPDNQGCLPPNLSPAPRPVVLHLGS